MIIYIVGNPFVAKDSKPLQLAPKLKRTFPQLSFREVDPNENFIPEEGSVIIDTVVGLPSVRLFTDLNEFMTTKSVSPHDYDLGFHLKLLQKLKKLHHITILGIPTDGHAEETVSVVCAHLQSLMNKRERKSQK